MAVEPLDALGDPELRSALLYVRGHARALTADELAAHQDVHRNVARARLERLVAAGLLEAALARRPRRAGPRPRRRSGDGSCARSVSRSVASSHARQA